MNEFMSYLKEKINELDQAKHKAIHLERELHQNTLKLERLQHDNYEMEQSLIDHEQLMEKQESQIGDLQSSLEDANKRLQDNSLLELLKSSEWNEIRRSLESTLTEQAQKINMLSVEIIEMDIAAKKNAEQLANTEKILEKYNNQLIEVYEKLERTEERVSTLCQLKTSRELELEKVLMKTSIFQQSLKEREKIVVVLQSELKLLKAENSRLNEINSDL